MSSSFAVLSGDVDDHIHRVESQSSLPGLGSAPAEVAMTLFMPSPQLSGSSPPWLPMDDLNCAASPSMTADRRRPSKLSCFPCCFRYGLVHIKKPLNLSSCAAFVIGCPDARAAPKMDFVKHMAAHGKPFNRAKMQKITRTSFSPARTSRFIISAYSVLGLKVFPFLRTACCALQPAPVPLHSRSSE